MRARPPGLFSPVLQPFHPCCTRRCLWGMACLQGRVGNVLLVVIAAALRLLHAAVRAPLLLALAAARPLWPGSPALAGAPLHSHQCCPLSARQGTSGLPQWIVSPCSPSGYVLLNVVYCPRALPRLLRPSVCCHFATSPHRAPWPVVGSPRAPRSLAFCHGLAGSRLLAISLLFGLVLWHVGALVASVWTVWLGHKCTLIGHSLDTPRPAYPRLL